MYTSNDKLTVFEISRMAIHNGPGIRTMVHFKGCPLNCAWCSTPESKCPEPQIAFMKEKCIGCGSCVAVCDGNGIHIDDNAVAERDWSLCTECMSCAKVCCSGAVSVVGRSYSADELYAEIIKDSAFFRRSGGGVTFSGGEPLMNVNHEMLKLLEKLKAAGISIGFDTSGQISRENLDAVIPYTDFFLWDIKQTDPELHKKYTGVDNHLILDNLLYADSLGADIYIRCPIITSVNDNDEYFSSLIAFLKKLHGVKEVHLLPLHHLGSTRYSKIGKADAFADMASVSREYLESMCARISENGYPSKIIG